MMLIEQFEEILPTKFQRCNVRYAIMLIWICRDNASANELAGKLLASGLKRGVIEPIGPMNPRTYRMKKASDEAGKYEG